MRYALENNFVKSGDLRVGMAKIADPEHAHRQMFDLIKSKDPFIIQKEKSLGYSPDHQLSRNLVSHILMSTMSNIHRVARVPGSSKYTAFTAGVAGMELNNTVMVCGAGPSYDNSLAAIARNSGARLLSLGNNIWVNREADYWIGRKSPLDYPTAAVNRRRLIRFCPIHSHTDRYFDMRLRTYRGPSVAELPNTYFFDMDDKKHSDVESVKGAAFIDNYGIESTYTLALSLCSLLGFDNIIFNGVDLGKVGDRWAYGDLMCEKDDRERKEVVYREIKQAMHRLVKIQHDRGIRLYDVSSATPLPGVSPLPREYFTHNIKDILKYPIPNENVSSAGLNAADRGIYTALTQKLQNTKMQAKHVVPMLDALVEAFPKEMGTPELLSAKAALDKELKNAKCTDCTKNRLGRKHFLAFQNLIVADEQKAFEIWTQYQPDIPCFYSGVHTIKFAKHAEKDEEEYLRLEKLKEAQK